MSCDFGGAVDQRPTSRPPASFRWIVGGFGEEQRGARALSVGLGAECADRRDDEPNQRDDRRKRADDVDDTQEADAEYVHAPNVSDA